MEMKAKVGVIQQKPRNPEITSNPYPAGREASEGTSPAATLALAFQPPQL